MSGKKQAIDVQKTTPVFKTLVAGQSTLKEAYYVSVQVDEASEKIKGAGQSVFGVMRHAMVQLFLEALKEAGDDIEKLNRESVAGKFLTQCDEAEKAFDYTVPSTRTKTTWSQAKSDLKSALLEGYNFADDQYVGQSQMNKWKRDVKKAKEEAEEAALRAQHGGTPSEGDDKTIISDKVEHKHYEGPVPGGNNQQIDIPAGLPSEVQQQLAELTSKLTELVSYDRIDKALGALKSASNQADQAIDKAKREAQKKLASRQAPQKNGTNG